VTDTPRTAFRERPFLKGTASEAPTVIHGAWPLVELAAQIGCFIGSTESIEHVGEGAVGRPHLPSEQMGATPPATGKC
jgi:hypothetical protein